MRSWTWIIVAILIIGIGAFAWFNKSLVGSIFSPKAAEPVIEEPQVPQVKTYASSTTGVSFDYPLEYSLNEAYQYTQFKNKPINGVSVVVPAAVATGTNLSADSYVAVEQLPRASACTGDIYILANVRAVDVMDGGVEYSVASTSGAAAGNRYEEIVYALKGSKPCTAVRYYIHTTAIENYEPGAVRAYDREALLSVFDQIRRTLLVSTI